MKTYILSHIESTKTRIQNKQILVREQVSHRTERRTTENPGREIFPGTYYKMFKAEVDDGNLVNCQSAWGSPAEVAKQTVRNAWMSTIKQSTKEQKKSLK